MADSDSIFTRLGRMLDKGVAVVKKKDDEFNKYLDKELPVEARQGRMLDKGVDKAEAALAHGLNRAASFLSKDAAKAASHIQGGESVNTANASTTPAVPKTAKSPNLREI